MAVATIRQQFVGDTVRTNNVQLLAETFLLLLGSFGSIILAALEN